MGSPLKRVSKGAFPSLLDTATANKLIDAINSLLSLTVAPNGAGKMVTGDGNAVLDLSGLISLLSKNQQSQDAINQTTSPGTPGGGGGGSGDSGRIDGIITALNNASITASCDDSGAITVNLTIPGLPPVGA